MEEAKVKARRSGGEVTYFLVQANPLGFLLSVDFESVGLGWGLRRCVSNELQGEYATPGHGPHSSGKGLK